MSPSLSPKPPGDPHPVPITPVPVPSPGTVPFPEVFTPLFIVLGRAGSVRDGDRDSWGAVWGQFGDFGGHFGAFLGPLWGLLGDNLGPFGDPLGPLGTLWGLFGDRLGTFRGPFGAFLWCFGGPFGALSGDPLGPFWGPFGASFGTLWGLYRDPLGPFGDTLALAGLVPAILSSGNKTPLVSTRASLCPPPAPCVPPPCPQEAGSRVGALYCHYQGGGGAVWGPPSRLLRPRGLRQRPQRVAGACGDRDGDSSGIP